MTNPRGILTDPLWRAPLVPIALAATLGVALDRSIGLPVPIGLIVALVGLIAWAVAHFGRHSGLPAVYLWLTVAALAAAYHHFRRDLYAADDIGNTITTEPRPAHLRGVLEEEPALHKQLPPDPLDSRLHGSRTVAVMAVAQMQQGSDWRTVSGRVRLDVEARLDGLHAGDEIDAIGQLSAPLPPSNPGEFDYSAHLRDQHIRAVLTVRKTAGGVARLREGWPKSLRGWLEMLRGSCRSQVEHAIPNEKTQGLALALLLGEGTALPEAEWDRYKSADGGG